MYFSLPIIFLLCFPSFSNTAVHAQEGRTFVSIVDVGSFTDSRGTKNIVGTVENNNNLPVQMLIGLNTTNNSSNTVSLIAKPFGKIIYPFREAPFKIKLSSSPDVKSIGKPFVYKARNINMPYYDVIRLNYSNTPIQNGSLIGSIKNIASFDIHDLTIYASAHNESGAQVDSVKSHLIPVLRSGETVMFSVSSDPAVRSKVSFYSCFGVDFSTTNIKIKLGDNRYITANMTGLATITNVKADPSTGSISINIYNQYPVPGPLSLKIPSIFNSPTIFVTVDGTLYRNSVTIMKGYTYVDLNIPAGKHIVNVSGIG
ncbi:MAG TPA: hypothetical protein VEH06_09045 [Candidatus Bathyarchaeia archaeon]|nr:hypothetical protein [Candidatus Bathyarchaeia archaeon]